MVHLNERGLRSIAGIFRPKIELSKKLTIKQRIIQAKKDWTDYPDARARFTMLFNAGAQDNIDVDWDKLKPSTKKKIIKHYGSFAHRIQGITKIG